MRALNRGYSCLKTILGLSFLVVASALAIWIAWQTIQDSHAFLLLQEAGIKTQAVVIQRRTDNTDGPNFKVTYGFSIPGQEQSLYRFEQDVDEGIYNVLDIGSMVDIVYLPDDPNISRIAGNSPDVLATLCGTSLLCSVSFLLFLVFVGLVQNSIRRDGNRTV